MPTLTGRIDHRVGAMVMVRIAPTARRAAILRRLGRPVVAGEEFLALLDTGASSSAIDARVARRLDLESSGFVSVHTPSTGSVSVNQDSYDATITLGAGAPGGLSVVCDVIECEFAAQGFFALIGRDVLSKCILTYDGPADRFILEY